jgi:hypothetical protein
MVFPPVLSHGIKGLAPATDLGVVITIFPVLRRRTVAVTGASEFTVKLSLFSSALRPLAVESRASGDGFL